MLYKGALGALGELWEYGQQAIRESGEAGVAASWGIKRVSLYIYISLDIALSYSPTVHIAHAHAHRDPASRVLYILYIETCPPATQANEIWFTLHTKYGGDVSKVTDCARISLEFATAEGLERAAKFVLQVASTFKNRMANPTDEGYRDLLFTVLVGGHACEVCAAPRPLLVWRTRGAAWTR